MELFRKTKGEERVLNDNPYLNARRTVNDYTSAVARSRRLWRVVALASLLVAIGAVGGIVHIACQSRFVPYVVEVDALGKTLATHRADKASEADERIIHASLAQFINDFRMVSFDRKVQNSAIWRVFAMLQSSDPATMKITEFMRDPLTSPVKRAEELSVGVEIASVLRQTQDTWEVTWTEKVWNRQGIRQEQYPMRCLVTVYFVSATAATTEEEIRRNPLGMFVRDITWSRVIE